MPIDGHPRGTFLAVRLASIYNCTKKMTSDDEERHIQTRMRVIYAIERINRLLEEPDSAGHQLPDETLELVVSCINAVSDVVERRLTLDSRFA